MSSSTCRHVDVREFDGLRSCLGCGETRFREPSASACSKELTKSTEPAEGHQEYLYTDLRCLERGQTIRLVILEPGEYDDPIRCSLVLSGVRHSEYEAVSYTWATESGDKEKSQSIFIDGSLFYITRNCEAALRRLRQHQVRRLWIDALCINQADLNERNHQVGLMDRIYREATCVHVCIRDPSHDYSPCVSWLSGQKRYSGVVGGSRGQLERLIDLQYFKRVWVLQEVALAKRLVLHVNNDFAELNDEILSSLVAHLKIKGYSPPPPFVARSQQGAQWRISQVVKIAKQSLCSDPRDRIYGVLSLLTPRLRALIPIDYSLHLNQVMANVLSSCMASTHSLEMLHFVHLDGQAENLETASSFTSIHLDQYLDTETADADFPSEKKIPFWSEHNLIAASQFNLSQEQVRIPLIPGQILPGLKIRSLCLDFLIGPGTRQSELIFQAKMVASDNFLGQRYGMYALKHRREFGMFWMEDSLSMGLEMRMFDTQYGSGFSTAHSLSNDQLCRIEGTSSLFLLRHLVSDRYRIVGPCHWQQTSSPGGEEWIDIEADAVGNAAERTRVLEVY